VSAGGGFADLRAAAGLYGVRVQRAANLADVLLLPCPKCGKAAKVMEQTDSEGNRAGLVMWCDCDPRWRRISPDNLKREWERQRRRPAGEVEALEGEGAAPVRYARTDAGNAEHFAQLYGHLVRYVSPLRGWRVWSGQRWAHDEKGAVEQLGVLTARDRFAGAAALPDPRERLEEAKHATRSENHVKVRDLLASAATLPDLACVPSDFDRDPMLLNCANGVVDLRDGGPLPHDPKLMLSKMAGAEYQPEARGERWEAFLREVFGGDEDLIAFVRRLAGYTATGRVDEHVLVFCYGGGNNGKSVLLNTLRAALGDYALHGEFSTFTVERERQGGAREDLARLLSVRLLTAAEASGASQFSEATIKATTSSDPIVARFLYGHTFEFVPTHTTWLAANVKPRVRDTSLGLWRRMLLVPFEQDFSGRADLHLEEKLRGELAAVLSWCVRGAVEWQAEGLNPPAKVRAATAEYRQREDVIATFLAECVACDPQAEVSAKDLYTTYCAWCERTGERPLPQRYFGEDMGKHGHPSERGSGGLWRYRGLKLGAE